MVRSHFVVLHAWERMAQEKRLAIAQNVEQKWTYNTKREKPKAVPKYGGKYEM